MPPPPAAAAPTRLHSMPPPPASASTRRHIHSPPHLPASTRRPRPPPAAIHASTCHPLGFRPPPPNRVEASRLRVEESRLRVEEIRRSDRASVSQLVRAFFRDFGHMDATFSASELTAASERHDASQEWRGRRHEEAVLEKVLHETEEKAELILDERAEHQKMAEAYALMDQKLQQALQEHDNFENTIMNLKSELKRRERDYSVAQKEIDDLQKQVAVLLKECQDIQLRCGSSLPNVGDGAFSANISIAVSNVENNIKDDMAFKDINGLVQQNVQLRNQVHMLSADLDKKDMELRECFQIELKKITDDAASRVEKVMKKSEEQAIMIESLHRSVAMYRKLCEEQQKTRSNVESVPNNLQDSDRTDLMVMFEGSQEVSKKAYEQVSERARSLNEELTKLRAELVSLRSECDKAVLEADFARDRLNGFTAELEHQRKETNSISLRNAELMHLIVDYERRLREDSDSKQALEENSRKLSMELASSAEDVKVQTSVKVGDDSGDHQETKNLNNELDLSSSSSGEAALLPGNGPGTAEAENTTVNAADIPGTDNSSAIPPFEGTIESQGAENIVVSAVECEEMKQTRKVASDLTSRGDRGIRCMKLRTRTVFMAPSRQPPMPRALGLVKSTTTSVDMDPERTPACRSDTAEVGDDHILQESGLNLGNNMNNERRKTTSSSRAHFQAGQKKAQAKRVALESQIWSEHREIQFCTYYLDLLSSHQDFKELECKEKFKIIAQIMTEKSPRVYSHKQLKDKFAKLITLYKVYISPEVRRSSAWWKKRYGAAYKKIGNGESLPIFELIRKIVEIEKPKAKVPMFIFKAQMAPVAGHNQSVVTHL